MLEEFIIGPEWSVRRTIEYMEEKNLKGICITDSCRRLEGLFTYGDMRRFFLHDGDLSKEVRVAMNQMPHVFYSVKEVEEFRKDGEMVIYPVIDKDRKVLNVLYENDFNRNQKISNALAKVPLVIMAGGKGTRLYPYTKILPKALIPIGDLTITERIINEFHRYGCRHVYMVLKHKANMIRSYFDDLNSNYQVSYVEEAQSLGTAGGLRLLREKIHDTFFVSNCDVLIQADFECIYKVHRQQKNMITFVCAMKNLLIPYGIIETDSNGEIRQFKEKPEISFLTNTGLYVVEPEVVEQIQEAEQIHLPDLAKRCMDKGLKVGIFPITEKAWMDMGQFHEMETMMERLGIQ